MTVSQIIAATPAAATIYKSTDVNATKEGVKSSSAVIHAIVIDNSLNAAKTFLKLWNLASGSVTVGTTDPDMIIQMPASIKRTFIFFEGLTFDTGLTIAAVTVAGTPGVTGPTSDVNVEIIYV